MRELNLANRGLYEAEFRSTRFIWMLYVFNSGHFLSAIQENSLPFEVILAADTDSKGRALCHEFGRCQNVLSGIHDLLRFVNSEAELSLIGYMIHSPRRMKLESHVTFWRYQATIIARCRIKRGLNALIIQIHDASPNKLTDKFIKTLIYDGWLLMPVNAQYPSFGDSIDSSAVMILGIHSST